MDGLLNWNCFCDCENDTNTNERLCEYSLKQIMCTDISGYVVFRIKLVALSFTLKHIACFQ